MKRSITIQFLVLSFLLVSFLPINGTVTTTRLKVKAPFSMPAIHIADFSNCKKYIITDFEKLF